MVMIITAMVIILTIVMTMLMIVAVKLMMMIKDITVMTFRMKNITSIKMKIQVIKYLVTGE